MSKTVNIKKILWYSVENITTIIFSLLSVVLIARLFGPENLGKLSYVQAISALTIFITTMGLDHIIVRDLARNPKDMKYISTIFIAQLFAWVLQSIAMFLVIYVVNKGDIESDIIIIFTWVALTAYFSRATVVRFYYQAINAPHIIGNAALKSRFIALIFLGCALYYEFSYEYVLAFIPLQASLQFSILLYQFILKNKIKISFDVKLLKKVFNESIPLLIAAALYPIFMQADVVLIASMMTEKDAGIYSAASKIIMQFSFIGTIVTMAFYLPLSQRIDNKSDDMEMFFSGIIKILFIIALITIIFIFSFSDFIISILFGKEFSGASDVLKVLIWKTLFIYIAAIFSRVLVLMNLAKFELIKSLVAASFSLIANVIFIPLYGLYAAAIISVISYLLADLLLYSLFKKTKRIFYIALKSICDVFVHPFSTIKNINYVLVSK